MTSRISSTFCFSASFSDMCAATVSARRPGVLDAGERGQHLRRHLLVELHVLLELRDHRARRARPSRARRRLPTSGSSDDIGGVVLAGVQLLDARAIDALDQHLDGAVGQLQQLQDRRDGADAVQVLGLRVVDVGLLLRDQQDALVGLHRRFERLNRFLAADEQRDDHVRVNNDVPQRQHRHVLQDVAESGVRTRSSPR